MNINRLGLGCMGMSIKRNAERSAQTVHEAINYLFAASQG